jgi:putative transposase
MPRTGRVLLPHCPHHVVQRGHNRRRVFAEKHDYQRYLDNLAEFKRLFSVKVYAWCLMRNHVHLLLDPGGDAAAIGRLMKRVAGRQTRFYNRMHRATGTLWESRYKSSPVDRDDYLLACVRYIELNPVRAYLVAAPEDYPWSSCRYRLGEASCPWLDEDPGYLALGASEMRRRMQYWQFLRAAIPEDEWNVIRTAVRRNQLTGAANFVARAEEILGRRIRSRPPGRPVTAATK